jgi:hypothetical protein
MKTALITAELPDLVGKSLILATLTNNLPDGVSLADITIRDTETKVKVKTPKSKTQFQKAKAAAKKKKAPPVKIVTNTQIALSGTARNDIEVAGYIAALDESFLVRSVGLIESKQITVNDIESRRFKLKVMLKRNVKVTKEDIATIREKGAKMSQLNVSN